MNNEWIEHLSKAGDPIERKGVNEYGLGLAFPKYAEYWDQYVRPNRDPSDSSKLRPGLEPKVEDIINNGYGVFYQLVMALDQLNHLNNRFADMQANQVIDPFVDISPPFYHLASAIDLTERTFVATLRAKGDLRIERLPGDKFGAKVMVFWESEYAAQLEDFASSYRPVKIDLIDVHTIFEQHFPNKAFRSISGCIRHYRNVLIHSLCPLIVVKQGNTYIPKEPVLYKYVNARWSSERNVDRNDYALVQEIIREFADKLIASLNELWGSLLKLMGEIISEEHTEALLDRLIASPFDGVQSVNASGVQVDDITNTTSDVEWLKPRSKPPLNPSGYTVPKEGDSFD